MTRKEFLRQTAPLAAWPMLVSARLFAAESGQPGFPREMPPGIAAIIANTLKREPGSLNTDWFGTMLLHGLLRWSGRGLPEVRPFAVAWLEHHLAAKEVSRYAGRSSRKVRAGGVAITTYAGHFGLALPCHEMATRFGDARARQVCIDVGKHKMEWIPGFILRVADEMTS